MCNQCISTRPSCSEDIINNQESVSNKMFPSRILDAFLPLQHQWLSWMLAPYIHSMLRSLSKKLYEKKGFTSALRWKVLRKPCVVKSVLTCLLVFYVGIPIWFYLCPWFRRAAVFLHFADWPFQTLSHPEYYGLNSTKHFFVETSPGVLLGVWHVLPRSSTRSTSFQSLVSDNRLVVLYLHGSAESRSAAYRRHMYSVLSKKPLDAHVITFDYRGFGDSTFISPTAQTLEEDATAMFHWLKDRIPTSRIIIWGHSMGSGIAVRLGEAIAKSNNDSNPLAIILEAPFTSIAAATKTFPLSFFHRHMPFFERFCSERTRHTDTNLDSDARIGAVTSPLLILHAADDGMIWSEQGRKLWKRAVESSPPDAFQPVFVELDGKYGCGHRNIHKAPNMPVEVVRFLQNVAKYRKRRESS